MRFPVRALAPDLSRASTPPALGLGTWRAPKGQVGNAVAHALKVGYRHIDAAFVSPFFYLLSEIPDWAYRNEDEGLDASLKDLGTDYVDLLLMHWPVAFHNPEGKQTRGIPDERTGKMIEDPELSRNPLATWRAMEELVKKGKARHIGISNFNIRRTTELLPQTSIKPRFNQVEVNLLCPNEELRLASDRLGVQLESYSPLGSQENVKQYLSHPVVQDIAARLHATPAQVLLAWPIARGIITLAKSVTPTRIEENYGALHVARLLKEDDLTRLLNISRIEHRGRITRTVDPREGWGVEDDIFEDGIDQERA
ncbi:hypothetical protein OC845_002521 [Tilletia horrida]|nr:hypothetical protein OC845_002521 [Tilletia horrida]